MDVKTKESLEKEKITSKNGLLYRDGDVIHLPEADIISRKFNYPFAEKLVKDLEQEKI